MPVPDGSLRAGFLRQVALRPDAPALVVKDRIISFGELDQTARLWAGAIVGRLGGPAARVGVFGSRSEVSYIAALAALYSGAAFVPLNPRFPADRTRAMIRYGDLDAIFVDRLASTQLAAALAGLEITPPIWVPENDGTGELASAKPLDGPLPPLPPERMAYLLFTSGTTGIPKGCRSCTRMFVRSSIGLWTAIRSNQGTGSRRPLTRRLIFRCSTSSWRGRRARASMRCRRSIFWHRAGL
jgi:non-ribosomal peptide synthetase component F